MPVANDLAAPPSAKCQDEAKSTSVERVVENRRGVFSTGLDQTAGTGGVEGGKVLDSGHKDSWTVKLPRDYENASAGVKRE